MAGYEEEKDDVRAEEHRRRDDRARTLAWVRARRGPPGNPPEVPCAECGHVECKCCPTCKTAHLHDKCLIDPEAA